MSRVIVFDLDNHATGEFNARVNRGYFLYGHPGVDGAGGTTVKIPKSVALKPWLQLGRMIMVLHPKLPAWAGMIDSPWTANLPVEMTVYNGEYLFSLRTPEFPLSFTGSAAGLVQQMIALANQQEQTYLSIGKMSGQKTSREETLDQRTFWAQLVPLLERSGHEMVIRPEIGADRRLHLYADVGVDLGDDINYMLEDGGKYPNMSIVSAKVDGKIINRVKGVSSGTSGSQLETDVFEDELSQAQYRTRNTVLNYRDITQLSTLEDYTRVSLAGSKRPYLDMRVKAMDVGETFRSLAPGNRIWVRSSNVYLPGGVAGWRGQMRILAMAVDEDANAVVMNLRGEV